MIDSQERAFDLLQWVPFSLTAKYDDDLALAGYYGDLQKQRSDQAIDAWEQSHPYQSSDELIAFRELERLGVYSDNDFFSPAKAKDGYYSQRLRNHRSSAKSAGSSRSPKSVGRVRRKSSPY